LEAHPTERETFSIWILKKPFLNPKTKTHLPKTLVQTFFGWFVFLIVEEESARPTHHLPADFAINCFFASALAPDWRQVVANSTS
jgi:hypothetical protein